MKCKTSCFNPSLAKNDLRRFWPLPVCSFLMFFVSLVLPLYRHLYRAISGQLGYYTVDGESLVQIITAYAGTQFVIQTLILAAAALVTALLLFHHLHGKKEIQFYLSLPMRRSGLYLTSTLTGLLMILLPMVHGIAVGICLHFGVTIQPILQLLAACCLMFLLFYGIAVLSCVLAGQRFGAFLLYAGIHGAAIIIWVGLSQVAACFIPGFSASVDPPSWLTWQSPLLKLFSDGSLDPNNRIGLTIPMIYGVVGLVLLVFSGLLYQIRRAETAGDMLSFSVIKIISKIFAALAVGLGSFALLQILAFPNQSVSFGILMLLVLVLIAIGWIAAEMIIQKSFRIFHSRSVLVGCALLVVTAAAMLGAKADAFGYIHRLPNSDQVESASISLQYYQGYNYTTVSPADALALHEAALDHLDQLTAYDDRDSMLQFSVSCGLKDGGTMERTYYFDENVAPELKESILTVLDKPENVYNEIFNGWTTEPAADTFLNGWVSANYLDGSDIPNFSHNGGDSADLTAEEAVTLCKAVLQDIQDGNVIPPARLQSGNFNDGAVPSPIGYFYLTFAARPYNSAEESYSHYQETVRQQHASIDLYSTMTHTIAAMKDMGFQFR